VTTGNLRTAGTNTRELSYGFFALPLSLLFLFYFLAHFYFSSSASLPLPQAFLVFCLVQLSAADIKFHILQDQWILALALPAFCFPCTMSERVWGLLVPLLLYGITDLCCRGKQSPAPFGMGDAKLLACLGFVFGASGLYAISCAAFIASGFWSLGLLLLKKAAKKDRIAFGPFIALACVYFMLSTLCM
jgi:prepilin signal peptidase PulO-like enzyme (type II secretory pathway)